MFCRARKLWTTAIFIQKRLIKEGFRRALILENYVRKGSNGLRWEFHGGSGLMLQYSQCLWVSAYEWYDENVICDVFAFAVWPTKLALAWSTCSYELLVKAKRVVVLREEVEETVMAPHAGASIAAARITNMQCWTQLIPLSRDTTVANVRKGGVANRLIASQTTTSSDSHLPTFSLLDWWSVLSRLIDFFAFYDN